MNMSISSSVKIICEIRHVLTRDFFWVVHQVSIIVLVSKNLSTTPIQWQKTLKNVTGIIRRSHAQILPYIN